LKSIFATTGGMRDATNDPCAMVGRGVIRVDCIMPGQMRVWDSVLLMD